VEDYEAKTSAYEVAIRDDLGTTSEVLMAAIFGLGRDGREASTSGIRPVVPLRGLPVNISETLKKDLSEKQVVAATYLTFVEITALLVIAKQYKEVNRNLLGINLTLLDHEAAELEPRAIFWLEWVKAPPPS
jgi:hypothetical protein